MLEAVSCSYKGKTQPEISCFCLFQQALAHSILIPFCASNNCKQSRKKLAKFCKVQCCSIENQQTPVYVVDCHFSRSPDGCWECCHNFTLFNHLYHIWELSNEVLYNSLPKGVSKCYWTKLKVLLESEFRSFNFYPSYFWSPFRYRVIKYLIGKISDMV